MIILQIDSVLRKEMFVVQVNKHLATYNFM